MVGQSVQQKCDRTRSSDKLANQEVQSPQTNCHSLATPDNNELELATLLNYKPCDDDCEDKSRPNEVTQ